MSAPENPPAFPSVCLGDPGHPSSVPGLSKREYFAGQVLSAAFTYAATNIDRGSALGVLPEEWAAQIALSVADAMLAQREGV